MSEEAYSREQPTYSKKSSDVSTANSEHRHSPTHARKVEKENRTKKKTRHIEQVQTLADISRSALCCHSNESCAWIANPPNNAQLGTT